MTEISKCLDNLGVPMQTKLTKYMPAQGHRHTWCDTGWDALAVLDTHRSNDAVWHLLGVANTCPMHWIYSA